MRQISIQLLLFNHQPVGEEDEVIARAVDKAYRPMLSALEEFSHVRIGLRLGGHLLDWLESNDQAYIKQLKELVERGQIELLGGSH